MRQWTVLGCALVFIFAAGNAPAQTLDELKKENALLRARVKELEAARAGDAVVVGYDAATNKLTVRSGDKERVLELKPRTHVHDAEGFEVPALQRAEKLKAGVRVEIVEEDGRLEEINILGSGERRPGHKHKHDHDHDKDKHGQHDHPGTDYFRPFHSDEEHGKDKCCPSAEHDHTGTSHSHDHDKHAHKDHDRAADSEHKHEREITGFCDYRTWHRKNGHDHNGNGHANHGHGSVEGYPYPHMNRIEPAYLERALEITYAYARNADGGLFHEHELEAEFIWALNDRFQVIFAGPYRWLNATGRAEEGELLPRSVDGFGDLEVAAQFLAFNGERMKLSFALGVGIPTGSERRGLGEGNVILEPAAFGLLDFGHGWIMQAEAAFEMPVDAFEVENEFRFGVGLSRTLLCTEHCRFARWFAPMIEATGVTTLNGAESGRTTLELTPGLRWIMREHDDVGFGVSIPVAGDRDFQYQVLVKYLIHF